MSDNVNPTGNKGRSSTFLPKFYQTDSNKKFLQATLDQLISSGSINKINGYVGRENAKATTGDDIFVKAASAFRQQYQLEPGLVINDSLGNTTFFKDYQDYINQLNVLGANTANHTRLNQEETYSLNPHISWDMFINFQNYYWLPYGPPTIKIAGQQLDITSEYTVTIESEGNNNVYLFNPPGLERNPVIKLYRGQTYKFSVSSQDNPFMIKTARSTGTEHGYIDQGLIYKDSNGLVVTSVEVGTITFTVPYSAPDLLFYVSTTDSDLGGVFEIASIDENTSIDVENEVLNKKEYILPDGTALSNGMKIQFIGNVTPEKYSSGFYYVEGVGNAIRLIKESDLELLSPYTTAQTVLFDSTPFDVLPFSDATAFAGIPEYLVINRASKERSPWARYNRWFHKTVIETSARVNNIDLSLDQNTRAVRPIIEFEPDLQLFNYGSFSTVDLDIDLIDTFTTDVFSTIEGSTGYNVDGVDLVQGQRVLFLAETDSLVKNNVYRVNYLNLNGRRQIHLVEEYKPTVGVISVVRLGDKNRGQCYWFNGTEWVKGQEKYKRNQPPLFDVFDSEGVSFSDSSKYEGTTFAGTELFSYKPGTGTVDSVLGFALSYKNINNVGDIVFNFNFEQDSFEYKLGTEVKTQTINIGYLSHNTPAGIAYTNSWIKSDSHVSQAAVRIYKNSSKVNNFDIDIFNDINKLDDLIVKVYVNGIRLSKDKWAVVDGPNYKKIVLSSDIKSSDVLTIRTFAKQPINDNGYYEIPHNLQNNPLNESIQSLTLGEISDHVSTIVDNLPMFEGEFPGPNNLRDLGNVSSYGSKFLQHSGPISLSLYHITNLDNNVVKAIDIAKDEYNKFKKNFVSTAETLGVDGDPVTIVDLILQKLNKDKPKTNPYYFSDMIPYTAKVRTEIEVIDGRIKTYPLSKVFSMDLVSSSAVLIYLNGNQLMYRKDYTFDSQGFVVISAELAEGDIVAIDEYDSTNGSFVPPTPTKLGLWPKYEPMIYQDESLVTPRMMIQGHDGSQVLAYGDYRDALILELEKRIFNNIKVDYDPTIFDILDVIPGYSRNNSYSREEFDRVLAPNFYKWTSLVDRDFTKPLSYDRTDPFTFNYTYNPAPNGTSSPGYWKGIYRYMLDTDRPNLCPWEMMGFSIKPEWWETTYGPYPWTSENKILWDDIAEGIIREPGLPLRKNLKVARPFIKNLIPVDEQGKILSPLLSGLASGVITQATESDFVFGDVSPVESAWRRSSHYAFSVLKTAMLLMPAKTFGCLLDRSRIVRNVAGQLIYKDTGLRVTPMDIQVPSIYTSTTDVKTSGLINYIVDFILSDNLKSYNSYVYDLGNLEARLSYRVGAFTSKEKFNLLLDSKTPLSQGSVFVPQEDYSIVLNSSSPIKKINYSGIIVTKTSLDSPGSVGYEIKGYSKGQPYFKYFAWTNPGTKVNIGGISEAFTSWTQNSQYAAGKIVLYGGKYYRSKSLHTTGTDFALQYYEPLSSLPIVGGQDAFIRSTFDTSTELVVPYGTKFRTIQEVVDFILGYGEWLKSQGFIFDDFNSNLAQVSNWETSAKEFVYWTTRNWSLGQDQDVWVDWVPSLDIKVGDIVRFNGDYYRAFVNVSPAPIFEQESFTKLEGLSTLGSSVISLSPAAKKITFNTSLAVVDDVTSPFNDYEIFKVDGTPILPNFLNSYRDDNAVSYSPAGTDGIFSATFYLVQKEQVVILNNSTMFNDTIYNTASGYRQERIKISAYVSTDWKGSFEAPGFIFDQALINNWAPWTDYSLGDIVKYKEFYYSAKSFLIGTQDFNYEGWIKLADKPTPKLLPNWNYKAGQFTDFYSLDSDNFDSSQQTVAQHLVGYQKRDYLSNIIQDDVSEFKFYQGMIIEKGTQNVLNKLFDVLSADGEDSVNFYEEWALRVGQYGASSSFESIEFKLDESLFKNNPQGFELVNYVDKTINDFIIRQSPNDVYLKPVGYNSNPWPLYDTVPKYLRTPGHVRPSDAKIILSSIDGISTYSPSIMLEGDYVWCGFEKQSWDVYRYTSAKLDVTDVVYNPSSKELTISAKENIKLQIGTWVGINQTTSVNGFYQIKSVTNNQMVLSASLTTNLTGKFSEQDRILVFVFESRRSASIDNISHIVSQRLIDGEKIWTGGQDTSEPWATWEYSSVYNPSEITNSEPSQGQARGKRIVVNAAGTLIAVTDALGQIVIYDTVGLKSSWLRRQTISKPTLTVNPLGQNNADYLGDVIAMSPDGLWLATGTPLASYVSTNPQPGDGYIAVDTSSSSYNSTLANQGVISLYKKDENNIYSLVDSIVSPTPAANEKFGSNIIFDNDTMLVTASGYGTTGRVYVLNYLTTVKATTSYNPTGSSDLVLKVSSTQNIEVGMTVVGTGFASGQTVTDVVNGNTVYLSAAPDSTPSGIIQFTQTDWQYGPQNYLPGTLSTNSAFGKSMAVSKDGTKLLVSAPGAGKVYVYSTSSTNYSLIQTISSNDLEFGTGLAVSDNGTYIAISSILFDQVTVDKTIIDSGAVSVYKLTEGQYVKYQELTNISPATAQFFGTKLSFMNDYKTLVVYSPNASTREPIAFTDSTTFDDDSTQFLISKPDTGRIDIYDRYQNNWIYGETLTTDADKKSSYSQGFAVGNNRVIVGSPYQTDQGIVSGKVYDYTKSNNSYSWVKVYSQGDVVNLEKIKRAFLYNTKTNQLLTYLDAVDLSQGKIPGLADQEIKYKTFYDPAVYSIGDTSVNVDEGLAWASSQVGTLWWDLRTAKVIENSDSTDVVYRNSVWGMLFPTASIDVYEWVETKLKPSDWNSQADTEAGLANGISGTTLYDNTTYSVVKKYDSTAKAFKNTYYYWVKNKKTIPANKNRNLSAVEVANLISNPRGSGYKYFGLTSKNSFVLVNCQDLLENSEIAFSVEYWITENTNQNVHSQWKIISNDNISEIPYHIEQKWVDSLCGKDSVGRLVPDTTLPPKLRFGVENRPRQGMFINRFEALKQLVEKTNLLLINKQIVNNRDLSDLESYDVAPSTITGLYDVVFDVESELRFASIGNFRKPELIVGSIIDGKISSVTIVSKGAGYLIAPYISVTGVGQGAEIRAVLNTSGQIVGAEIISGGEGYDDNTILSVRNYSALVNSDSQLGGAWSIYSYETSTSLWSRVNSQSYNTTKFWSYADWYDTGYNQFTVSDYAVDNFSGLDLINPVIGKTVKIRKSSSGTWLLLEKYSDVKSIDWTQTYKVVGQENGTIQLSSSLYQFEKTVYGYDSSLFDSSVFDNSASTELRIILQTLKNKILIDDLRTEYLNLFFNSVRYVLSEQIYVDWVMKTSFVKAKHNVGELNQPVTYKNDNLVDYENFVNEVKPYRTVVREYISSYQRLDSSQSSVTDFDLPPALINGTVSPVETAIVDNAINVDAVIADTYPWKFWADFVGYSVVDIKVTDNGSGYLTPPAVRILSESGAGAVARAFVTSGKVTRVIVLSKGSGYLSAPTVVLDGNTTGSEAKAVAIIGNSVIRSNLIKVKFDRISQQYEISNLQEVETFTGTGSKKQFILKWAPDIRIGRTVVTLKLKTDLVAQEVLRDTYSVSIKSSVGVDHTVYYGVITFEVEPPKDSTITVTYVKDWSLLNAADRIQHYYNPAEGELGKDLSQLMTGIDYGGVVVTGMGFDLAKGWDSLPWFTDKWGVYDESFDDYIVTVSANTHSFTLPYVPEPGTELNVYYSKLNVEENVSDGVATSYNFNQLDIDPSVQVKTTVNVKGVTKQYNGIVGDVLQLNNVTGIEQGMSVIGTGFASGQTVTQIIDSTHVKLSDLPNTAPSGSLFFTKNIAGTNVLHVSDTSNLQAGDLISLTPAVVDTIGLDTKIVRVLTSTTVQLDQILFKNVTASTATFTRTLVTPTDYTIKINGIITLNEPVSLGSILTVSSLLKSVRLDDPNWTGSYMPEKPNAVMETVIVENDPSDPYVVSIPGTFQVNTGDQFIIRKSTSDGSILPQDADYDTAISGGDLAYSSAKGIAADEIIIDGDGFVTPTTSPAPEECVPGQVVDTLAIKIFDKPSAGSASMKVDSYLADGVQKEFIISQKPNSSQAVIVKFTRTERVNDVLTSVSEIKNDIVDYSVLYNSNTIKFVTPPPAGELVSIFSIGFNGTNLLDLDYFVGDGTTSEFVTQASWVESATYLVYVAGVPVSAVLFKTDSSYEASNRIGIKLAQPPIAGAVVNYIIVSGKTQTFSITKSETIIPNGGSIYDLENIVGDSLPAESNMLVRVDQQILPGPNNSYFTIGSNRLNYTIDSIKFVPFSVGIGDILVLANSRVLTLGRDYTVDLRGITVKINRSIYNSYNGKQLVVSVRRNQGYFYIPKSDNTPAQIQFSQSYTNEYIEVTSFYKHDVLDIQRTSINITSSLEITPDTPEYYRYVGLSGGVIPLDRSVIDDNYVWVLKNGTLLTPSVDFKVNKDRQSITLALPPNNDDEFTFITFSNNVLSSGIAYMQFKDMLNRTHFKRLSANKQTKLTQDLRFNDTTITVADASNFDIPNPARNKPGVVEIRGERIEYFSINGNVLGQLRRGTLGTGTPAIHLTGEYVQDIGASETIPYVEDVHIETIISDGTNNVDLNFIPAKADNTYTWFTQFGLTLTGDFYNFKSYAVNDIVVYNNLYYKCIKAITASSTALNTLYTPANTTYWTPYSTIPATHGQSDTLEVFAAGTRLKKKPYMLYNAANGPESPAADVHYTAEFAVDGTTRSVRLTTAIPFGTSITVVEKRGVDWDGKQTPNILNDDNKIAKFLKATPGVRYFSTKNSS
jgi:hypothetical protein